MLRPHKLLDPYLPFIRYLNHADHEEEFTMNYRYVQSIVLVHLC